MLSVTRCVWSRLTVFGSDCQVLFVNIDSHRASLSLLRIATTRDAERCTGAVLVSARTPENRRNFEHPFAWLLESIPTSLSRGHGLAASGLQESTAAKATATIGKTITGNVVTGSSLSAGATPSRKTLTSDEDKGTRKVFVTGKEPR